MNKRLLLRIADAIEAQPKLYYQGNWAALVDEDAEDPSACGSTMCVAGWAATLAGWKLDYDTSGSRSFTSFCKKKDNVRFIQDVANEVLDLPEARGESHHTLFEASWMRGENVSDVADELRRIAMGDSPLPGAENYA